jgi:hypothetical protein
MPHPDADQLALAALDETLDPEATHHVRECQQCSAELEELRRVVRAAQRSEGPVELTPPPPTLWDRIVAETGVAARTEQVAPAAPVDLGAQRRRSLRRLPMLAAAAVGLVLGAAGASVVATLVGDDGVDDGGAGTVATARLRPLPDSEARGRATLVRSDGSRRLDVSVSVSSVQQGFREVWLLDAEAGRLVSLGVLEGQQGSFTLPAELDLGAYPTVDISAEPFDGDPAHSGDSLARGDLEF